MLSKKSRLLVTNQLQYLPQADKIIYVESGRVIGQGSYEKMSLIPGFKSLLNEFNSKAEEQPPPEQTAAMAAMQQDQMFGELNAAEGHANVTGTSTVHAPVTVHHPALSTPVTNAAVSEAFADSAAPGAAIQRNLLVNDADAVEPLHHNVQLVRQESAEEDAGLDLDDAVTRYVVKLVLLYSTYSHLLFTSSAVLYIPATVCQRPHSIVMHRKQVLDWSAVLCYAVPCCAVTIQMSAGKHQESSDATHWTPLLPGLVAPMTPLMPQTQAWTESTALTLPALAPAMAQPT